MSTAVLALDQGTTGSTALVYDREGRVLARAYAELPQSYPQPGWVEHDPEAIWRLTLRVAEEAIARAGVTPAALGITNQRETTVVWDRTSGAPVHPAVVWQSRQTAAICERLRGEGHEPLFRRRSGLLLDPYFSGTKIRWILDRDRELQRRARDGALAFGTIDTWLIWKLTGGAVHATDPTNASRTLLYDIHERRFHPDLLQLLDVPEAMLPAVRPSAGLFGTTVAHGTLPAGIPITGVAGDQQAALFGQCCFEPGLAKNTYGTGCFLMANTGADVHTSTHGLLSTLCCDGQGQPAAALEGAVFVAGAAVQWLRDELRIIGSATETDAIARSVPDTQGVYVVPAFTGLGAPWWDMHARGAILGLTRGAGRAQLVRATLESLAYQTRDVVEAMNADSGAPLTELRVDGGAAANDFLMQFQADLLGIPVDRPANVETTAAGAALLAGLGAGVWPEPGALSRIRRTERRFEPTLAPARREELYAGWKDAVARVRTGR